jgi:hypothetical protein
MHPERDRAITAAYASGLKGARPGKPILVIQVSGARTEKANAGTRLRQGAIGFSSVNRLGPVHTIRIVALLPQSGPGKARGEKFSDSK